MMRQAMGKQVGQAMAAGAGAALLLLTLSFCSPGSQHVLLRNEGPRRALGVAGQELNVLHHSVPLVATAAAPGGGDQQHALLGQQLVHWQQQQPLVRQLQPEVDPCSRSHVLSDDLLHKQRLKAQYSLQREGGTKPVLAHDYLRHLIVVPEHKLLFCYIPKVSCSAFNAVFISLRRRYDPSMAGGSLYHRNTYSYHNLTKANVEKMMVDPKWHKAVFYRDPMERFLSAYRSKCVPGLDSQHDQFNVCKEVFGVDKPTFEEAVGLMVAGKAGMSNPHFVGQADMCGGLTSVLPYFQTVEVLNPLTSRNRLGALLRQVGVDPESIPAFNEHFPPPGAGEDGRPDSIHITRAEAHLADAYKSPRLACAVMKQYLSDYLLFGMRVPAWVTDRWDFNAQRWAKVDCATLPEH